MQLNIRGLIGKQNDLLKLANSLCGTQKLDIILLQETWLKKDTLCRVNIPGYKHYAAHRINKSGGGVSILVSDNLKSRSLLLDIPSKYFESIASEIQLPNKKLILCSMYRPPNTVAKDFLDYYSKTMKKLTKNRNSTVICGLDHNLDFLKHTNHGVMNDFINNIIDHDLMPCIARPTRVTKSTSTLIDNILVDKQIYEEIYSGVAIHDLSDHFPCLWTWPNALPDTNKFKMGY